MGGFRGFKRFGRWCWRLRRSFYRMILTPYRGSHDLDPGPDLVPDLDPNPDPDLARASPLFTSPFLYDILVTVTLNCMNVRYVMTEKREGLDELKQLGSRNTKYTYDYDPGLLEKIPNKHSDRDFFIKFNCPEFTSLCPKTGQPDFATIYISYIPDKYMVESKSLKLYLFSYRNHGDFHEDCVNMIMTDLIRLLRPRYIEVWGKFLPRGGLSIDPYCNYGIPGTEWKDFARFRLLHHDMNPEKVDNR